MQRLKLLTFLLPLLFLSASKAEVEDKKQTDPGALMWICAFSPLSPGASIEHTSDEKCKIVDAKDPAQKALLESTGNRIYQTTVIYHPNDIAEIRTSMGGDESYSSFYNLKNKILSGGVGNVFAIDTKRSLAAGFNHDGVALYYLSNVKQEPINLVKIEDLSSEDARLKNAVEEVRFEKENVVVTYSDQNNKTQTKKFRLTN